MIILSQELITVKSKRLNVNNGLQKNQKNKYGWFIC